MKILAIAAVALKRFARDRANLFFVFILPIGIIILIGAQFGSGFAPSLGIHVGADGGAVAESIFSGLEASGEVDVVRYDSRDAVLDAVALGEIVAGVAIPDKLSERLIAGESVTIELIGPVDVVIGGYQAILSDAVAEATEAEAAIRFAIDRGATREAAAANSRSAPPAS